jgi:hypothetical protein
MARRLDGLVLDFWDSEQGKRLTLLRKQGLQKAGK